MNLYENKGLTLLEVMISLIILSVGVLGLAPLLVVSIEANNMSSDAIISSNIARDKIEYLESLDSIPSSTFSEFESNVQPGYDRTTIIQDNTTDSTIPGDLLRASIAVEWVDKVGVNRKIVVASYLQKK